MLHFSRSDADNFRYELDTSLYIVYIMQLVTQMVAFHCACELGLPLRVGQTGTRKPQPSLGIKQTDTILPTYLLYDDAIVVRVRSVIS